MAPSPVAPATADFKNRRRSVVGPEEGSTTFAMVISRVMSKGSEIGYPLLVLPYVYPRRWSNDPRVCPQKAAVGGVSLWSRELTRHAQKENKDGVRHRAFLPRRN